MNMSVELGSSSLLTIAWVPLLGLSAKPIQNFVGKLTLFMSQVLSTTQNNMITSVSICDDQGGCAKCKPSSF